MSLQQNHNESKEGDAQFINEDEEKKDEYTTPQFPPSENQNQNSSIRSNSHSHININNDTNHSNSSHSSLPTHIRSISDQSIVIQSNIHKYPNVSQFSSTSSGPRSTSPPQFIASKSLSHLNQPRTNSNSNSNSIQSNHQKSKPSQSSSNIQRRYFNKSKYYQYITTEIQLITTIIHQHLTISNANNHSSSSSSISSNGNNSRYIQSKSSLLHAGSSTSQSLNGSAASYTLKQWQINNFFQNLLKQFEYTRFSMSFNDNKICRFECILPFCLVIEQNESPSSITAVSINCLTNLLNSTFISLDSPNCKQCIQLIGNTICSVILDVEQKEFDEGLLLKFMNLISSLLNNKCYIYLSESMILNIFEKCLYIYFNVNANQHSEALFEFAEITITLLIQRIFQRLPQLLSPKKVNMDQKNGQNQARRNSISSQRKAQQSQRGKYISLKDKILINNNKSNNNNTNNSYSASTDDGNDRITVNKFRITEPFNIDCIVRIFSALCSSNPESFFGGDKSGNNITGEHEHNIHDINDNDGDEDSEMDSNRLIICLNLILISIRESGTYFHKIPRLLSLITDKLCYILLNYGKNTKYIMLYELCLRTYVELCYKLRSQIKLQNEIIFRMLFIRVLKSGLPMLLPANMVNEDESLFNTDKVDDILAKSASDNNINEDEEEQKYPTINLDASPKQYDLSTMSLMTNDGSIMTSSNNRDFDAQSTSSIRSNQTATTNRTTATDRSGTGKSGNSHSQARVAGYGGKLDDIYVKTCLEHLLDLCRSSWFIKELFLNYDCDLYSSNLCNDLITLLSKHTIPGVGVLDNIHYLALQCLVNITQALSEENNGNKDVGDDKKRKKINIIELRSIQQKKKILTNGIEIFNNNPDKGMIYLYENGILGNNISRDIFTKTGSKKGNKKNNNLDMKDNIAALIKMDTVDKIVDILFYCSMLNKAKIGYYLGEPHVLNEKVRIRYIQRRYSFADTTLDIALRLFLEDLRLPVETQQVDRIIQAFANQYCIENNGIGNWKMSPSTTYTLCFALLMLHTNQHNANIKHKRMSLEQFVNLVRNVKDANNIEIELLEKLYESMTMNEMKLCDDDSNILVNNTRNISVSSWNLLIKRSRNGSTKYVDTVKMDGNEGNMDVLNIIFNPLIASFSVIFDVIKQKEEQKEMNKNFIKFFIPINHDELVRIVLTGFYHLSLFIYNEMEKEKMDAMVLRLTQLTGLNEIGNIKCGINYSKSYCKKEISHLLFNILQEFAGNCCTNKGWNCILQVIIQCARLSLLPSTMYQLDDFVGGDLAGRPINRSFKYLYQIDQYLLKLQITNLQKKTKEEQDSTLFGFIAKFVEFVNPSDDDNIAKQQKERKLLESARIILQDYCKINAVIKKSSNFNIESVRYLIKTLIFYSNFGIINRNNKNIKQNIVILSYNIPLSTSSGIRGGSPSSSTPSSPSQSSSYISNKGMPQTRQSVSTSFTNIAKDKVNRIKSSTINRLSPQKQINYIFIDKITNLPVLQTSCLCVQFLTSILLHNWRRIDYIWDIIITHFKQLLDIQHNIYQNVFNQPEYDYDNDNDEEEIEQELPRYTLQDYECLHEAMVESAVIGILKICVRGLQLPCNKITQRIMSSLKLIATLSVNNFHHYRNVSYQITAAMNRFIKQICEKRLRYLKHKKQTTLSRSRSQSQSSSSNASSSSSLAGSPSRASRSGSDINSIRSHHAKRLSDYQWWLVTPWKEVFVIIKLASSRYTTVDIACRIFLSILGVFDENDNSQPFLARNGSKELKIKNNKDNNNNDIDNHLEILQYESKLVFLPNNPELMDTVFELFEVFTKAEFHSDSVLKIMMIKGICNILEEMPFYHAIITGKYDKNNKGKNKDKIDNDQPGDMNNTQEMEMKIWKIIRIFIMYIIKLCGSLSAVIRTKALLLMEYVLLRSSICNIFINNNIEFIKDIIIKILCEQLIMVQLCSSKMKSQSVNLRNNINNISCVNGRVDTNLFELITKSRVFAVCLINKYFLQNLSVLYRDQNFRDIWKRILCCSDIMLEMKSDPKYNELYTSVKESLKNVLQVMMQKNIINDQNDLSNMTWQKLDNMFPRMKTELFNINNNGIKPREYKKDNNQQDNKQRDRNNVNVNISEYGHPTPTPYSRIDGQPQINEKYIRRESSLTNTSNTTSTSMISKDIVDVSSIGSEEIVLVD